LLAQKPFIVPIPGTSKVGHLLENVASTAVELTAEDLAMIDAAVSAIAVHGGRMNEVQMQVVEQ
jgi:aryl-alcohol dehydrogenase-like predicted oxidoreductase